MNREGRKLNKKIRFAVLISACLLLPSTAGQLDAYVKGSSDVAPDFTLTDIDGNVFSLSEYRGKVGLLDFCGTWCIPCVQEISHLKGLYEELGEKLVIISTSPEDEEVLRDFRDEYGIGWTVARDTANVFDVYSIYTIPTLMIIDQEGYIRYTHVGLTEESILRSEIESLLPKTIYVDNDNASGPWDGTQQYPYLNITSGLKHASIGDTIFVYEGTYNESVIVNKRVSLIGENKYNTIIDGNRKGAVIRLDSNNITISGFTIQKSGYHFPDAGISVSSGNNISHSILRNNNDAILLYYYSSNNLVFGNTVLNNDHGIYIFHHSSNNTISGNNVSNNWRGITVYDQSSNNTLTGNTVSSNKYGIELIGAALINNEIYNNNFINNTQQVDINTWDSYNNVSDDGYPSGGNYWSDYEWRYPDAEEVDDSSIWDTPYFIDENNQDNYPLMKPWTPTPSIPTTIHECKTEIERLGSEGEIDNQGIAKSLIAKLNAVQKLVDKGKIEEAKTILKEAFIMEVQKLTDIHITPEAAELLIESAEYIISHL